MRWYWGAMLTVREKQRRRKKVINFATSILFARRRFQPGTFVIARPQNYSNGRGERIHSCTHTHTHTHTHTRRMPEAAPGKIEGRAVTDLMADRLSTLPVPVTPTTRWCGIPPRKNVPLNSDFSGVLLASFIFELACEHLEMFSPANEWKHLRQLFNRSR